MMNEKQNQRSHRDRGRAARGPDEPEATHGRHGEASAQIVEEVGGWLRGAEHLENVFGVVESRGLSAALRAESEVLLQLGLLAGKQIPVEIGTEPVRDSAAGHGSASCARR
jgi:hypothetical protein